MSRIEPAPELEQRRALAERVRQALLDTALAAHEDAGIRGLCCEGQWEAVVTALRGLDLAGLIAEPRSSAGSSEADIPSRNR